eukprot:Hpha_TRINITY_DN18749_c0_g1::TRINITY_DN18749_c0_g1_i1::g.47546::m.47546
MWGERVVVLLACIDTVTGVLSVVAGGRHTCAIQDDYTLRCWGANADGQLGLGDTDTRGDDPGEMEILPAVRPDPDFTKALIVALGGSDNSGDKWGSTCAVLERSSDGAQKVRCWGRNTHGQLGAGDTVQRGHTMPPLNNLVDVPLGCDPALLKAGEEHFCALCKDMLRVRCWGRNNYGQIGVDIGFPPYPDIIGGPIRDVGLGLQTGETVADVVLGGAFTCVLTSNGRVRCWGRNSVGTLGRSAPGPQVDNANLPSNALQICAGEHYACALLDSKRVYCWGQNEDCQLMRTSVYPFTSTPGPTEENFSPKPKLLQCGADFSCVTLEDNTIKCWGRNKNGQLGAEASFSDSCGLLSAESSQLALPATPAVDELVLGGEHACAILETRELVCWGRGGDGEVGSGGTADVGDKPGSMTIKPMSLGESRAPSVSPTALPSTPTPTVSPSFSPSAYPSSFPSRAPSTSPSTSPPTGSPTRHPSTSRPSASPSGTPTMPPSQQPSLFPSRRPSVGPSSSSPSISPSASPLTSTPTSPPTVAPTLAPTSGPTAAPTV